MSAADLQKAVVGALRADAGLLAIIGSATNVRDFVPPDRTFPFVAIGRATARDNSTDTLAGEEHVMTIRCWSRATSRAEVLAMAERVSAALADYTGTEGATRIVAILPVSADHGYEPAELAWLATVRVRALAEPA
jgi:hypothetical protein